MSTPKPFSLITDKLGFSSLESFGDNGTIGAVSTSADATRNIDVVKKGFGLVSGTPSLYGRSSPYSSNDDAIDSNGIVTFQHDSNNPSADVTDIRVEDRNAVLIQQNMLYIMASITAATLIVAAIVISRK